MSCEKIEIKVDYDENKWGGIINFSDGFAIVSADTIDELVEEIRGAHDAYLDMRGDFDD